LGKEQSTEHRFIVVTLFLIC